MKISKKHPFTGKINEMDLPITQEQLNRWKNGETIQKVMPNLTIDQREFLITGTLPGDWDELFGEDE